jgi:hypothetical protein
MAVKSKEEIMGVLHDRFKDDTDDSTLSFIEDVSDTINDLAGKASGENDWQKKYEDNDKMWREKYRDRFFSAPIEEPAPKEETDAHSYGYKEDGTPMSYNDLFK